MSDTDKPGQRGKTIHPRLSDDLHARVATYAAAEGRTISNAVIFLIERGLAARLRADAAYPPISDPLHLR